MPQLLQVSAVRKSKIFFKNNKPEPESWQVSSGCKNAILLGETVYYREDVLL